MDASGPGHYIKYVPSKLPSAVLHQTITGQNNGFREWFQIMSGVAPTNQTKERSVHELFAGAFRNRSSIWIVLVFLRKNTRIHKNGWNSWTFRFGPFPANQTKERSVHELFAGATLNQNSMWIVLVFPRKKTPEFTKMGEIHELFVLPLSLLFGLPGRLPIMYCATWPENLFPNVCTSCHLFWPESVLKHLENPNLLK